MCRESRQRSSNEHRNFFGTHQNSLDCTSNKHRNFFGIARLHLKRVFQAVPKTSIFQFPERPLRLKNNFFQSQKSSKKSFKKSHFLLTFSILFSYFLMFKILHESLKPCKNQRKSSFSESQKRSQKVLFLSIKQSFFRAAKKLHLRWFLQCFKRFRLFVITKK